MGNTFKNDSTIEQQTWLKCSFVVDLDMFVSIINPRWLPQQETFILINWMLFNNQVSNISAIFITLGKSVFSSFYQCVYKKEVLVIFMTRIRSQTINHVLVSVGTNISIATRKKWWISHRVEKQPCRGQLMITPNKPLYIKSC